jgi:hypothetical protein
VNRFDDFFDVEQGVGSPDVIAVQIARPRGIVGRSGVQSVAVVHEACEVLSENPGLTVGASSHSRLGGLDGQVCVVRKPVGPARWRDVPGAGDVGDRSGPEAVDRLLHDPAGARRRDGRRLGGEVE